MHGYIYDRLKTFLKKTENRELGTDKDRVTNQKRHRNTVGEKGGKVNQLWCVKQKKKDQNVPESMEKGISWIDGRKPGGGLKKENYKKKISEKRGGAERGEI